MSSQHLFKKFLLEGRKLPQLSQIYHHIYFRDLNEQLIAANHDMFHYFDFPFSSNEKVIPYNQLISDPTKLNAVRENDACVLNTNKAVIINEKSLRGDDFLSIKTPIYDENKIIGLCGISLSFGSAELNSFTDVLIEINKLFQNPTIDNESGKVETSFLINKPKLTSREQDCLFFYMKGYSSKEIAAKLNLSSRTIESHIDNIKSKLGVNKRSELLTRAFKLYPDLV